MVGIASGLELIDAIKFANVCAGLKTIKMGAQTGMPTMKEVRTYVKKNKIEIKGLDKINL